MKKYFRDNIYLFGFSIAVLVLCVTSCRRDDILAEGNPRIETSTDTLTFDTVFTAVGSATRSFKIYNREDADVLVTVSLQRGGQSFFRINVDGLSGTTVEEVRIGANDSIYVYADVNIDPDQPLSVSPYVIEEQLSITANGTETPVLLEAWGQNANYVPGRTAKGLLSRLTCDLGTETWDDPKPYVIYGILFIDSCELVLPAGTEVYVHGGVVITDASIYSDGLIIVQADGRIVAEGTASDPVTFQGVRLEESFDDSPGQWVGIRLLTNSRGNRLEHVIVRNSVVGVRADSLSELTLASCEIKNTTSSGLIGIHAEISATNTLVHSNGSNAVTLVHGGDYDFTYCTFASFGNQFPALRMDNFFVYPQEDAPDIVSTNPLSATLTNTIIVGNDDDELSLIDATDGEPGFFQYQLTNCIVKVDELLDTEQWPDFFDNCTDCDNLTISDPLFVDFNEADYQLDTLSVAEGRALPIATLQTDLNDNSRDATNPDIGCFEYQQ